MTPILQQLHVSQESAFFAKTFDSSQFNAPWHHHNELEMVLIIKGNGSCIVGNYSGKYNTGDIFLIGANVPHTFKRCDSTIRCGAVLVQFKSDFLGTDFMSLHESSTISNLFTQAKSGIKVSRTCKMILNSRIKELEFQRGFDRILNLCSCLNIIATDREYELLSTMDDHNFNMQKRNRLDNVFKFTIQEFTRQITLKEVADLAGMSIPAFCNNFRKSVKKTYIEFLNEVRLSRTCKLLIESDLNISEIFLSCGYNTPANFNKQFLKYKGMSPSDFRKRFSAQ